MRLAFGRWRLSPAAFWSMTPREVAAVLAPPPSTAADRATLDALMRRFPDASAGSEGAATRPWRSVRPTPEG